MVSANVLSLSLGLLTVLWSEDPEELVVEKVQRSLASMAGIGLFQRSKTWELIDVVVRFTMHPNLWVRQGKWLEHLDFKLL